VDGDEEEFTDDENQVDWFQQKSGNNLATPFMILIKAMFRYRFPFFPVI